MIEFVDVTNGVIEKDGTNVPVPSDIIKAFGNTIVSEDDFKDPVNFLSKIAKLFGSIEDIRIIGTNTAGHELTVYGDKISFYGVMNTGMGLTQEFEWDTSDKKVYSAYTGNWID